MDIPAMFGGAVAEFDARVWQIGEHQWRAATPDEGWARLIGASAARVRAWSPPVQTWAFWVRQVR